MATVINEVDARNVRRHVETIVADIPHRAAGSDNGRRMAEYSRDAMRAVGVADTHVHELPAIVSFPEHADFAVKAPTEIAIQANTLGHSVKTMPEGITGDLVYVGSGAFADYDGKDVRGKIILTELSYSPARHEKQRIAALMGAIGCVMMNWGHPENEAVPFGSVKPAWGTPTPETFEIEMATLPCIGISRAAGLKLKDMCADGPVRVWLATHVENGWRPVQITVGEIAIEASPEPDDFILVGGHQDSWPGEAATDNAAGNACMIELARVFNEHRGELRRGLVFGFWTAHETGTMAGSSWFADRNWDKLRDHAAAYFQIDQPGCVGTTRWATSSNAELKSFHDRIETALLGGRENYWKRAAKSGDSSFFGLGIPMFHGEGSFTAQELKDTALATLGWWHHSIENKLDKLDWDWMQVHMQIYAAYLWELCTAPVLPFTYRPVADQILDRLRELAAAGEPVGLPGVVEKAEAFAAAADQLDALAADWRERFEAGNGDEAAAVALNGAFRKLSRMLVPLQSSAKGTYGQDTYGYTPQTTMIPCLYDIPKLSGLSDGGGPLDAGDQARARPQPRCRHARRCARRHRRHPPHAELRAGPMSRSPTILYQLVAPMEVTAGVEEIARRRAFLTRYAAAGTTIDVRSIARGTAGNREPLRRRPGRAVPHRQHRRGVRGRRHHRLLLRSGAGPGAGAAGRPGGRAGRGGDASGAAARRALLDHLAERDRLQPRARPGAPDRPQRALRVLPRDGPLGAGAGEAGPRRAGADRGQRHALPGGWRGRPRARLHEHGLPRPHRRAAGAPRRACGQSRRRRAQDGGDDALTRRDAKPANLAATAGQTRARSRGPHGNNIDNRGVAGMKKSLLMSVALLATLMAVSPKVAEAQDEPSELVWGDTLPKGLDPHVVYDVPMQFVLLNSYDGLYRYIGNPPELSPWLAESHEVSDDGLTWTITLKPDVTFHDGSPLTADDVVYSFTRLLEMGQGPSGAFKPVLQPDNVTKVDDLTVQFVLDQPYAPFLAALPLVAIVNEDLVKEHEQDGDWGATWLSSNEAGSGAYAIDPSTYRPQENLDMMRFEDHFYGWDDNPNPVDISRARTGAGDVDPRARADARRRRRDRLLPADRPG